MKVGSVLAKEIGIKNVTFEGDIEMAMRALNEDTNYMTLFGKIMWGAQKMDWFGLNTHDTKGNYVAHAH